MSGPAPGPGAGERPSAGSVGLRIPKLLGQGSYFPGFPEPRRTAEGALAAVRDPGGLRAGRLHPQRRDGLVKAMGLTGISESRVARLCAAIDQRVDAFLARPIAGDRPSSPWIDATRVKGRAAGRIVPAAVIIAVAVNTDGRREVPGMAVVGPSEAGPFRTGFLRSPMRRGRRGVRSVISEAHEGLGGPRGAQGGRGQGAGRHVAKVSDSHDPNAIDRWGRRSARPGREVGCAAG